MPKRVIDQKRETAQKSLSRRAFLVTSVAAGGGLLLRFYLPGRIDAKAQATSDELLRPNAFVRIRPDDSITLVMPQVEMGQGTYTSMPMLIAEELEVDLTKVSLEAAPADERLYANPLIGFQVTGGSTLYRHFPDIGNAVAIVRPETVRQTKIARSNAFGRDAICRAGVEEQAPPLQAARAT